MPLDIAIPVLTFLAGAFLGHRFNLIRDRRNEYNAAAAEIREHVMGENPEVFCMRKSPSEFKLALLVDRSPRWKRKALLAAIEEYNAAKGDWVQDAIGGVSQRDINRASIAKDRLLSFTNLR